MLCQYKNILGKPNEGVHSHRIFGYAFVDILLTIIVAYYAHKYYGKGKDLGMFIAGSFLLGIIVHRIFCVNTKLNVQIFGEVPVEETPAPVEETPSTIVA